MGKLPMTRRWRAVIELISAGADPAEVAASTTKAAEQSLKEAGDNEVLRYAVWLLTQIPLATKTGDFGGRLRELSLQVGDAPNLIEIGAAMLDAIDNVAQDPSRQRDDVDEIASKVAAESLVSVASRNGNSLFGITYAANEAFVSLRALSTDRQFSVLSRDFFSRLIRSFLSYFLSRAIPEHVGTNRRFQSIQDHHAFDGALEAHCREASLIIEQYSCDWFSKANYEGGITLEKAGKFVHVSLNKITAELRARRLVHA